MIAYPAAPRDFLRLSRRIIIRNVSTSPSKLTTQIYPLYPSVAQLLHEKGIPLSEADKIPAHGPKGRLLKGDVLAYLGSIPSSYSSDQSLRISKLGHLDLSNIQVAPSAAPAETNLPAKTSSKASSLPVEVTRDTEVTVPISLTAVLEVQKRVQSALGITLPVSTFIARATEIANEQLPRTHTPSADELFEQILGFDKVGLKTSRGTFEPQFKSVAPPEYPSKSASRKVSKKQPDIIDILTKGSVGLRTSSKTDIPNLMGLEKSNGNAATNIFSVTVPKEEGKRAKVFLERVKTILQVEPGSLVL